MMNFGFLLLALSLVLVPFVASHDDLELRVEVLEAESVQINNEVDDVEGVADQNPGQLFEIRNDLDDVDDLQEQRIRSLEEENSLLRLKLKVLEQLVNSNTIEIQALNQMVSDLDIDNSTNKRFDALESDVITLEGGFTQLESDVTTLEAAFTQLESDITTLESYVTTFESDITALDVSTNQMLNDLEENNGGNGNYSETAFIATHSAETFTPSDPIVWDTAILNPGGHYNPESGIYTVPLDGIYQFVLHQRNYGDYNADAFLMVDNVQTAYLNNRDDSFSSDTAEMTLMLTLTSGQQVWLSPGGIDGMYGTNPDGYIYSWFSGYMIYPL